MAMSLRMTSLGSDSPSAMTTAIAPGPASQPEGVHFDCEVGEDQVPKEERREED